MSRGKMFIPSAANQLLNLRLPEAPAPECCTCSAALTDVRPFHAEPAGVGMFRLACLAQCTHCQARHVGFRSVALDGRNATRFLLQEFEIYSEATHGKDLKKVAEQIAKKRAKFDEIQSRPVVDAQ